MLLIILEYSLSGYLMDKRRKILNLTLIQITTFEVASHAMVIFIRVF